MTKRSSLATYALLGVAAMFAAASSLYAADSALGNALGGAETSWVSSVTFTAAMMNDVTIQFPINVTSNGERIMNYTVNYVKGKKILDAELTEIKETSFE